MSLPAEGPWFAYVAVDGQRAAAPVQLAVGVPAAPGSKPLQVLAVADLSGPGAARCRAHIIGLQIAIGRINAGGGLDGGHKLAALVLDDSGSAARAAEVAKKAIASEHPIAVAGVCGDGGAAAVALGSRAGLPSIIGDGAVDPTNASKVFRLAADPYAEGLATGQAIIQQARTSDLPGIRTIRAVIARDAQGIRRLAGLREALQATHLRLHTTPPGTLAGRDDRQLARLLDRRNTLALVIDEPAEGGADASALARFGRTDPAIPPAPILASDRVLSEGFVQSAGALGRLGVLQGVSEVSPKTRDGILYSQAVGLLYRSEHATLDGLRGYVTGLALQDATRDGTSAPAMSAALRRPDVFTDALLAPWSPRQPGAGSPSLISLQPEFLPATLVPVSAGGESFTGTYFPSGTWSLTSATPLGLNADTLAPVVQ